jgi:hypothetical protein
VPEGLAISDDEESRLGEQAGRVPETALVRSLDVLSDALAEVREGDEPRMTIEVALLRCARPQVDPSRQALAERMERLEARLGGASSPRPDPPPAAEVPPSEPPEPEDAEPTVEAASGSPASAGVDIERIVGLWPAVVDHVRQSGSELLSAVYEAARPLAVDAEEAVLKVGFPPSAAFNKRKAEAQGNRERFAEAVRTIVGERLRPVYVLLDDETLATAEGGVELTEEELVEQIKSTFDAEEILEEESA